MVCAADYEDSYFLLQQLFLALSGRHQALEVGQPGIAVYSYAKGTY
jgi:hypothetical protein